MSEQNPETAQGEVVTLKGRVDRVFFSSPDFTAGRIVPDSDGKPVSFAGPLMVSEHDQVVLHGEWTNHEKFGKQLKVKRFEFNQELSEKGLVGFLANHPDFKGVGFSTAKKLAEAFGEDFGRVLEEEPQKIVDISGLKMPAVEQMKRKWLETKELNSTMTWLASFDLTHNQITKLIDRFGNSVTTVLNQDPYVIAQRVKGFGFKRADEIARKMGMDPTHPTRIRGAVLHVLEEKRERNGDCFVELEELIGAAQKVMSDAGTVPYDSIDRSIGELSEKEKLVSVKYYGAEGTSRIGVGLAEMYEMERWLYDFFKSAKAVMNPHLEYLLEVGESVGEGLQGKQQDALSCARDETCLLMTGGAGSGKTFTIASIVRLYEEAELSVALAAPTGKAARRIEEVAEHEALTIHRLLEYKGTGFDRNEKNQIDADVVIIDEVSMLDVSLAYHLFRAINLKKTAIVLVGDHNQLPPVGPGNVLRDLLQRKLVKTVELDKIIRQAGLLRENSAAILKSKVQPSVPPEGEVGVDEGVKAPWNVARTPKFVHGGEAKKYILSLFEKILTEKLGFDILRDVQVLTPKHDGPLGTVELNRSLQVLVQKKLWNVDTPEVAPGRRPKLLLHDRVIQTKNDYDSGIMNGSVGNVVNEKPCIVSFDGEEVEYPSERVHDLELAYALTIHKAQGSEFPCVVLVIHRDHAFMHHKNLFYTGVTRARKSVFIVGDPDGITRCAAKGEVDRRRTFLSVF